MSVYFERPADLRTPLPPDALERAIDATVRRFGEMRLTSPDPHPLPARITAEQLRHILVGDDY
ncbi:MAG: hypothetical protein ACLQU1_29020 [Bryobacteraceae bacterium]